MKTSPYRLRARAILAKVLIEHAGASPKQMRRHCREAFKKALWQEHAHGRRIRQEETALALGETLKSRKPRPVPAESIMPSMRQWAASQGLIKSTPTSNVWQD
jgi:hypothetical protein